jgi:hypothetical protein
VRAALGKLRAEIEREQLDWPEARRLLAARVPEDAIAAALALVDRHRAAHELPCDRRPPDIEDWRAPAPTPQAVAAAREAAVGVPARSATLLVPAFESEPLLLFEGDAATVAAALELAGRGTRVHVATTRLAEDSWRSGFRWLPLLASGVHVAGEPLAPRVGLPEERWLAELVDYRAFNAVSYARSFLAGLRTLGRWPFVLPQLELARRLAAGEAPSLEPGRAPQPASDEEWTRSALEIWAGYRSVAGQQDGLPARRSRLR